MLHEQHHQPHDDEHGPYIKKNWFYWPEIVIFSDIPQEVFLRTRRVAEKHVDVGSASPIQRIVITHPLIVSCV